MILLDVTVSIILFILGLQIKNFFNCFSSKDKRILNILYLFHLSVSIAFCFYILNFGGDALIYWFETAGFRNTSLAEVIDMVNMGSAAGNLFLLNFFPARILQLSFFVGNIFYGLLGYTAFVCFYAVIKESFPEIFDLKQMKILGVSLFPTILFLPNLHFWSSGIGKDTFIFFCIALFVFSLGNLKKRFFGIALSLILAFTVRPHIVLFLLVSFGIAYTLVGNLKTYQKLFVLLLLIVGFFSVFNYVLQFVELESVETDTIENYAATKAQKLGGSSGSAVDINSYPFPLKVFTFLYRPLFFDANGILGLVASVENFILLIFSLKVISKKPWKFFKKSGVREIGLLLFFILGACSFSLILGNLGIMLRQKTPFIMAFLIYGFGVLLRARKLKQYNELEKNI